VFRLGAVRLSGEGVARDDVEGGKLILKAAKGGVPPAMDAVARLYASGKGGMVRDQDQALLWVLRAASAGDDNGMEDLGLMYHTGADGLPANDLEAAHWFHGAAVHGWPNAMYQLGMLYLEGRGVAVDQAEGLKWLKAAAAKGDADAAARLKALGVN
jgi:TPR repeat protein